MLVEEELLHNALSTTYHLARGGGQVQGIVAHKLLHCTMRQLCKPIRLSLRHVASYFFSCIPAATNETFNSTTHRSPLTFARALILFVPAIGLGSPIRKIPDCTSAPSRLSSVSVYIITPTSTCASLPLRLPHERGILDRLPFQYG